MLPTFFRGFSLSTARVVTREGGLTWHHYLSQNFPCSKFFSSCSIRKLPLQKVLFVKICYSTYECNMNWCNMAVESSGKLRKTWRETLNNLGEFWKLLKIGERSEKFSGKLWKTQWSTWVKFWKMLIIFGKWRKGLENFGKSLENIGRTLSKRLKQFW